MSPLGRGRLVSVFVLLEFLGHHGSQAAKKSEYMGVLIFSSGLVNKVRTFSSHTSL